MSYAIKSVTVRCVIEDDLHSSPDDKSFVGVLAVADIEMCLASYPCGSAGHDAVTSSGLWGIESDSSREYLAVVYDGEVADLKARLAALGITEEQITVEPC